VKLSERLEKKMLGESTITEPGKIRTWNPIKFIKVVKIAMNKTKTDSVKFNEIKEVFKNEPEIYKMLDDMLKKELDYDMGKKV
jgi:hypothetical protein